jgi:hypothetical protein
MTQGYAEHADAADKARISFLVISKEGSVRHLKHPERQ